jgi:hypothetical protein
LIRRLLASSLACLAGTAAAHDSWFEPLATARRGEHWLALGTGNQFPLRETAISAEYLQAQGCKRADGKTKPMATLRYTSNALILRAASNPAEALSCWVQLTPFQIEIAADKVAIYLDEVRPPQAVLDAWAAMQGRGLPWKERYTKHARIELQDADGTDAVATSPTGMGMDALLAAARSPLQTGDRLDFQLLRDGQPLPDFAVELRHESKPAGLWQRTDGNGRLQFKPPQPGRWLLRAIDLRLSASEPDTWDSRFVTLAFSVQGASAAP